MRSVLQLINKVRFLIACGWALFSPATGWFPVCFACIRHWRHQNRRVQWAKQAVMTAKLWRDVSRD